VPADPGQVRFDPYQTTVPLVQVPVEQMQQATTPAPPLQGQFGKPGTGALAIGDSIVKGFLQGHQMLQQRKYAQATATIAAADKSANDAYQQYQEALSSGKDPAAADAAYKNYQDIFNRAKAAKAQFVLPEKPAKGQGGKGAKDKLKGIGGGIKEWLAANPHVVPEIALMSMQPKPPGPSQETKATNLEVQRQQQVVDEGKVQLDQAKAREAAQKTVAQYASLTPEEVAALPADQKKELAAAKSILTPQTATTRYQTLVDPQGQQHSVPIGTEIPEGWKVYEKPTGSAAKPGSPAFYADQYAKENGISPNDLTTQDLDYIKAKMAWDSQQSSSSSNTTLKPDPVTGQMVPVTITNSRNKGKAPQPPSGRKEIGTQAAPGAAPQGAMTAPPSPPARKTAATGGMTAPPSQSGNVRIGDPTKLKSAQMAQNTQKVETEKRDRYQKAQDKFDKTIAANRAKVLPEDLEKANKAALDELNKEHDEIEKWYNGQVHAIGGSVPGDKKGDPPPPAGATMVYRDPKTKAIKGYAVNGQYVALGK
jgi:hypothetical protein